MVRRDGNDVKLKPVFSRHLEDQWIPFARTVIDHFLMFGFVVVSIEPESPPAFANLLGQGKQVAALSNTRSAAAPNRTPGGPAGRRDHTVDNDAAAARARKKPLVSDEEAAKRSLASEERDLHSRRSNLSLAAQNSPSRPHSPRASTAQSAPKSDL